jgi:hypothetical protein
MTLEITRPETEARIQRYLQSGQFHDLDELLTKALDALPEPDAPVTRPPSIEEMQHRTLHEFFMSSPLRGANLNLERMEDYPRVVEIE